MPQNETKRLRDLEIDAYQKDCLQVEPMAIQEEFIRIPADLGYWNEKYAQASRGFLEAKADLKRTRAMTFLRSRVTLQSETGRATEAVIEATVDSHPDVIQAEVALIHATVERDRVWGVLDAIRSKKDMLISIGAHLRAEMQGDPSIRRQARDAGEIGRQYPRRSED